MSDFLKLSLQVRILIQQFKKTLGYFIPNRVFQAASSQQEHFALLKNKKYNSAALIHICDSAGCELPVKDFRESVHFHSGLTFIKD